VGTTRVAVDIGGTFTDLVIVGDGPPRLVKVPTTPAALEEGVLQSLKHVEAPGDAAFIHGSTVVVNAVLERKGARVGLVASRGFRDVIFIGRTERKDIYNLRYRKPEPFVTRERVLEVAGRMGADGVERLPLDRAAVPRLAKQLKRLGVESVAVALHNAYANPAHERELADLLAPYLPGVPITLSHELSREWREYERTQTTVISAFVRPVTERYLERLEERLETVGHRGPRALLSSAGGTVDFAHGCRNPIQLVESGPAGGVLGAQALAEMLELGDIVTLDIGGTTAKTSRVVNGRTAMRSQYALESSPVSPGYPVQVPTIDLVEIGAGGGSIIAAGPEGDVRVGPVSAGARPGPAAYGLGGDLPTVTDVLLLTGRISPGVFLGGALALDVELARRALLPVAEALGASWRDTAVGALRVAQSRMAQAIHLVTVARGEDPRGSALVAFGGGGPIHAAELADLMGMRRVVIPPLAGVFSAWGMAIAPPRADVAQTLVTAWPAGSEAARRAGAELAEEAASRLKAQGVAPEAVRITYQADLRYQGQEHAVTVTVSDLGDADLVAESFAEGHRRLYGFVLADPLELVAVRVAALGPAPDRSLPRQQAVPGRAVASGARETYFEASGWIRVPVYHLAALSAGQSLTGPALVEGDTTTVSVPPGWHLDAGERGELQLRREGER
jgi:N-methylhydantoinase A